MVLKKNSDGTFSFQLGPWVSGLFVALFMFLLGQSVIALRWGSQLDQRVAAIETVIQEAKTERSSSHVSDRELQVRLARLEERLSLVYETLRRFEERLMPRRTSIDSHDRP